MDLLKIPTNSSHTNMNDLADCFLRGQNPLRTVRKLTSDNFSPGGFPTIPLVKNGYFV